MNQPIIDHRTTSLSHWVKEKLNIEQMELSVASADASFRRYFRIRHNGQSWIAMDAPPDKEDIKPFIKVATAFHSINVNVPEIFAYDLAQGFMLIEDFGHQCYQDLLTAANAEKLYADAMKALLELQTHTKPTDVTFPPYDNALLMREMQLFIDWFLIKHLAIDIDSIQQSILTNTFEELAANALAQPQLWVHRDYHSRNLMVIDEDNPGIIDFQDAVVGAVTYDLVSLLRDCYIAWPLAQVESWVMSYLSQLQARGICSQVDEAQFMKWFDLMGMQRHLKAIGIFSRLNYRDGKAGYLADIPRTLNYVRYVATKYPEFEDFHRLLADRILPVMLQKE